MSKVRLYVGGLSPEVTKETMEKMFNRFGGLENIDMVQDNKVHYTTLLLNTPAPLSWLCLLGLFHRGGSQEMCANMIHHLPAKVYLLIMEPSGGVLP
jgi:hypothetical protein